MVPSGLRFVTLMLAGGMASSASTTPALSASLACICAETTAAAAAAAAFCALKAASGPLLSWAAASPALPAVAGRTV